MTKVFKGLLLAVFVAALIIISYWIGQQAYAWMPPQATAESKRVDELFSFLVSLGTFVFLGIFGLIAYSILTGRAAKGDLSDGPAIEGNPKLEALWTGIPVLLVLWIATQSYSIYQELDIQGLTSLVHQHLPLEVQPAHAQSGSGTQPVAEAIEVTAKQWAWSFRYPGGVTSTELHLPVNQRTRLVLRSQDVLHGFYVPEFRVKQDIIPNRTIDFIFTPLREGNYTLHDSQFSGTYFALMEADVYVESSDAYNQWLAQAVISELAPAPNQAVSEHSQLLQKPLRSHWSTVQPSQPPVVNYPN